MSSRGRFSSRFIKSGHFQRPSNSDRDSSFRRHQTNERNKRLVLGGQGTSREDSYKWDSDSEHISFEHSRGRERRYAAHNTRSYIRSPRSRYFKGSQINNRQQEREIHSLRHYKQRSQSRFSEDKVSIFDDEADEEFLILDDADDLDLQFQIEAINSNDENEELNECKIPFEREISPLIIHRNFESESLKSDSQERTLRRSRSPLGSKCRSIDNYDHENSFGRHSRRSSFSRRTLSRSPRASQDRLNGNRKGSITRSAASCRTSKSNKRSKERELFREEKVESNSLDFIRKQIEHEKQRQRFLERQTRRHKKRSESSVERLLNDCKTSIEMLSESSPANISSYDTQNTKQSDDEKPLCIENSSSPNVNVHEPEKLDTTVQLEKSEHKNSSDNLDPKTFSKKENSTNNSPEIRPELSPISQAGSFDLVELSPDKKDHNVNILNLSPISQVGSYEKREFSDHVENRMDLSPISQTGSFEDADINDKPAENELLLSPVSQASSFDQIDKNLELSPISQPGSFEKREFSQDQVFSPISLSGSFGKDDLECVPTQKPDVERPNSADSLQKFLEGFRYSEGSRSSGSVCSKKSTKSTFPKHVTNNSTLDFGAVNDRYRKEYHFSENDHVSKVQNNNVGGTRTSYRKHSFHETAEARIGSYTQTYEAKRRKYDVCNINIQHGSTIDRLNYNFSQDFECSTNVHIQRSKGNDERYQNIFQDRAQFYPSHEKSITTNELFGQNLNRSSFQQDLESKNQSFTNYPPPSALYNKFSGSNKQHSGNSINRSNVNEYLNRQIQNIQQNIHQVPIKSVARNEFPGSSNNNLLLVNRVAQYRPMNQGYSHLKQEVQTYRNPTNITYSDSGHNYGISGSLNKPPIQMGTQIMPIRNDKPQTQTIPSSTFMFGQNQSVPSSLPGVFNTKSQNEHLPYQAGQSGLTLKRPIQNNQVNQTAPSWNLSRGDFNNLQSIFDERYRRLNVGVPENSSYQTNSTPSQPQHTLGFQNPPIFKEMHIQNEIPLNKGQAYLSQSQAQNVPTDYKTLIQCLNRPPPPIPHFQQYNAGISNTIMTKGLEKLTPAPAFQQSPWNTNTIITKGLEKLTPAPAFQQSPGNTNTIMTKGLEKLTPAPAFQQSPGNTNQRSKFPDYNTPNLSVTKSDRLNQYMPSQSNIPPYNAQLAQGQYSFNNSQIIQNPGSSQTATTSTFLSNTRNLLEPQFSSAPNNATNPHLVVLKQPICVDLKKYLTGTLKPDYKRALGYDVSGDCEGSIGDYQPPVSACFPSPVFKMRFKDTPVPPEELGVMFDKFVIFFDVKQSSELEEDPFVIIQDSFSKSDRFGRLDIEEQSQSSYAILHTPHKHTCVLRWKGVMLTKADGDTMAEARQKASISLINALAHTCYTVQSKYSYYFGGKLPKFMTKTPENPGTYKIIEKNEITQSVTDVVKMLKGRGINNMYIGHRGVDPTNITVVLDLIDDFFLTEKNSFCELIFGASAYMGFHLKDLRLISAHVNKCDFLQWRSISGFGRTTYIAISRRFTPQELCSFLLAIQDNSIRYKLLPPQEPGIELLMPDCQYNFNINKSIVNVQKPVIPVHIQPGNRGTFQRSVPFHGGGRGGEPGGNWMGFS